MSDLKIRVKSVNEQNAITDFEVISGTVESRGYAGYNSGIVKFVNKDTQEEIISNLVTEEFEGTIQLDTNGSITGVDIVNPGKGYQVGTQVTITGAISRANASPVITNFKITDITLDTPGTGYRSQDTQVKFINPSTGLEIQLEPAELEPIFDSTDTILTGINIVANGQGYPANAGLRIRNTRVQALATATVVAGELASITVTREGKGYVPSLAQVKFIDPSTGLQITPLEFPVVDIDIDSQGNLTDINIVDPGSGLPAEVLVQVLFNNPATNATGSLQINSQGAITGATLISAGSGLRSSTTVVEIVNSLNQVIQREKAQYTAIIDSQGNLTGFNKISEGIGYQPNTQVQITDNFSSASLSAQVNSNGEVEGFNIIQAGSGYRNPGLDLSLPSGSSYLFKASATALFEDGVLTAVELLEPGKGYNPINTAAIIIDESAQSCPDGVESQNVWLNVLGPEVYALAVEALTPEDPTFVRKEPIYDYCGRLIGYEEVVIAGDRAAEGGNPLDGAVTEPLDLSHEFVWINAPAEQRIGWGVTGRESEQLIGPTGNKRLTQALDLNPEVTLYRGQSHIFSIPSGITKEFYIYETIEDPDGRPVTRADGTVIKLKPNISKKFSQGLHRFETGEYLEEANGRNDTYLNGPGGEVLPDDSIEVKNQKEWLNAGNFGIAPATWKRQDLYPEGSTLLFQIGEGDTSVLLKHWPDFLAYSDANGTIFGILRLV